MNSLKITVFDKSHLKDVKRLIIGGLLSSPILCAIMFVLIYFGYTCTESFPTDLKAASQSGSPFISMSWIISLYFIIMVFTCCVAPIVWLACMFVYTSGNSIRGVFNIFNSDNALIRSPLIMLAISVACGMFISGTLLLIQKISGESSSSTESHFWKMVINVLIAIYHGWLYVSYLVNTSVRFPLSYLSSDERRHFGQQGVDRNLTTITYLISLVAIISSFAFAFETLPFELTATLCWLVVTPVLYVIYFNHMLPPKAITMFSPKLKPVMGEV